MFPKRCITIIYCKSIKYICVAKILIKFQFTKYKNINNTCDTYIYIRIYYKKKIKNLLSSCNYFLFLLFSLFFCNDYIINRTITNLENSILDIYIYIYMCVSFSSSLILFFINSKIIVSFINILKIKSKER